MKAVICLGGSLITEANADKLKEYSKAINQVKKGCEKLVVVVGAGDLKQYIEKARKLGVSETSCDLLGIRCSRLNAYLLKTVVGLQTEIPQSVEELAGREQEDLIIMGGTEPGHSTDSVAALAADVINADVLVNATYVDGVYEQDPAQNQEAEKIKELDYKQLIDLLHDKEIKAGSYAFFDLNGAKILQRAGIRMRVVDGREPQDIIKAVEGINRGSEVIPASDK